jgi:hypothetical protein
VERITEFDTGGGRRMQEIHLQARYDPNKSPEDQSFAESTPSGEMKFTVTNQTVIDQFKPGQEYYIDLVPVE